MKQICNLLSIFCIIISGGIRAQSCGNSDSTACVPGNLTNPGFKSSSFPCAIRTVPYNSTLQFKMYSDFNFAGDEAIDSVQITGINNFPCGLCWATNHVNNLFYPNDQGCLNLSGTAVDSAGQYPIEIALVAWVNGNPAQVVPAKLVNDAGVRLWVPVLPAPGTCLPIDTASASPKNKYSGCVAGIDEISQHLSLLRITPNPISTSAALSFTSDNEANYQMRITDIAGRLVSMRQLQIRSGENRVTIERNSLPPGLYFITLAGSYSLVTRKFVIAD